MRQFRKYPSNYVKATAYYVSKTQMDDWKDIARAYAKKVGAELLFVNETSFGIEYPDGQMQHIRFEDLAELLGAGDIEASTKIQASTNYTVLINDTYNAEVVLDECGCPYSYYDDEREGEYNLTEDGLNALDQAGISYRILS